MKKTTAFVITIQFAIIIAGGFYLGYSTIGHRRSEINLAEIKAREQTFLNGIAELEKQGSIIAGTGEDVARSVDSIVERGERIDILIERALRGMRTLEALLGLLEDSYGIELHLGLGPGEP